MKRSATGKRHVARLQGGKGENEAMKDERENLLFLTGKGYSVRKIANLMQRSPSTISRELLEEFDRVIFKSLVKKITALSNKEIEIEFECGITVRETL